MKVIAVTQTGLKELKRSGKFWEKIEGCYEAAKRTGKEITLVYKMTDDTMHVSKRYIGYTIQ